MRKNENEFRNGPAFDLFFNELRLHLTEVKELLDSPEDMPVGDTIQMHFHRMKGAAGLFGFHRVGVIAKKIGLRLKADTRCSEELQILLLKYVAVVEALLSEQGDRRDA